ncbi:hypothetical protein [Gordonia hydrophobica]|uniref:Uncharacterized protein n=1 Tax=Gordonia hydrophobica TaxID=40516 RepID=A0ABZ2U6T9_9ACTN|nr:hypothetical protein [Gordonia hydrophobica]MBM7365348.1 hypothetical protein [Gordonia hydrophobica]
MLARINLSVDAVFVGLDASIDSFNIASTLDIVGGPRTEATREHRRWALARGLPFGFDPR